MECYRVLKPGGTCRVVVPDLFEPARRYVDEYMKVIEEVKQGNYQAKVSIDLNYLYHNEDKQFDHQYMYDFITLAKVFYKAGFVKIEESTPLSSKIPDIKSIEKRTDPVKNLYLECVKPA
jgi:predicted SAM-dependent methyltransferase